MSDKADSRRAAAVSEALPTLGVGAVVALMGIRGFTATKSIPRFAIESIQLSLASLSSFDLRSHSLVNIVCPTRLPTIQLAGRSGLRHPVRRGRLPHPGPGHQRLWPHHRPRYRPHAHARLLWLFLTGTTRISHTRTHSTAHAHAATSLTLAGVMGSRFARTRKLYPAGVLAAVGAGSSAWHGYSVFVRVEHQVADALHSAKETGKHEVEKIERKLSGKD